MTRLGMMYGQRTRKIIQMMFHRSYNVLISLMKIKLENMNMQTCRGKLDHLIAEYSTLMSFTTDAETFYKQCSQFSWYLLLLDFHKTIQSTMWFKNSSYNSPLFILLKALQHLPGIHLPWSLTPLIVVVEMEDLVDDVLPVMVDLTTTTATIGDMLKKNVAPKLANKSQLDNVTQVKTPTSDITISTTKYYEFRKL